MARSLKSAVGDAFIVANFLNQRPLAELEIICYTSRSPFLESRSLVSKRIIRHSVGKPIIKVDYYEDFGICHSSFRATAKIGMVWS